MLQEKCDLIEIGNVFDHLNIVYKKHLNKKIMNTSQLQNDYMIISESLRCKVVIEQLDVYKHVFVKLIDQLESAKGKYKFTFISVIQNVSYFIYNANNNSFFFKK